MARLSQTRSSDEAWRSAGAMTPKGKGTGPAKHSSLTSTFGPVFKKIELKDLCFCFCFCVYFFLLPSLPPWQPLSRPTFVRWLRWTWLRTPRFRAAGS